MRTIDISEIKSIQEYDAERDRWRPQLLTLKNRRRIRVGDHLTFLFENRETVRYQIQEMIRIERITRAEDVAHEVETYNELIPAAGELSASLLIEYETPEERAVKLRDLLGLDQHIWLAVGSTPRVPAKFDGRQIGDARLSSVQYIKFSLGPERVAAWHAGAKIIVDHRYYNVERPLTLQELDELGQDFR